MPAWLTPLRETVGKWSEHKDARLGAALAYYSVFSIGPLILIAIAIAGLLSAPKPCKARFSVR
jgi:membrane protein